MEKFEQKVYSLGNASGNEISKTDNLLIVINGEKTSLKLKDFFLKYEQEEDKIIGYSIFAAMPIVENRIQFSEEISINLLNKNTDEEIFITKIRNPFVQLPDKEMDKDTLSAIINDTWSRIKEELNKEEELIDPKDVDLEAMAEKNKELNDAAEAERMAREEKPANEESIVCDSFDQDAQELIEEGYELLANKNFRLLYSEDKKPDHIFVVLVSADAYQRVKTKSIKVDEDKIIVDVDGLKEPLEFLYPIEEEIQES